MLYSVSAGCLITDLSISHCPAQKGSKDLIEQAKIAMKEYGDIRMVYQDDGGEDAATANCKNNLLGRRPAGERKRYRFAMRPPARQACCLFYAVAFIFNSSLNMKC
jgi:hypothetical protein